MRKKIYGIATALTLAMGCSLFMTYPVQAAETQDVQQEESDYFTLPNGKKFLAIRKLKNGKTVKFYDLHAYTDGKAVYGKAIYDGEEFQVRNFDLELDKGDFENPGYKENDKSTQKFSAYGKPETYFPALTATKKVNDLINTYKDPSKHLLSEKVDKTTTVYKEMEVAAKEATKNCKTDYEKIVTICDYVGKTIKYDVTKRHTNWTMTQAWTNKCGVCGQMAEIMERMVQILGIPACYVSNEDHACNISYDKDTKQWVYSDPTSGVPNFNVYSRAASDWFKIDDVSGLKKDNNYFKLYYNWPEKTADAEYDDWDLTNRWAISLQGKYYTEPTDVVVDMPELDGIPLKLISSGAFYNNAMVTSLTLKNPIERIAYRAFCNASNLKNISFYNKGEGIDFIDTLAFSDCRSLESIDLSNSSITEIPKNAFSNCTSLKTVKLPPTVTKIADDAFANCKKLEEIQGLSNCKISEIGTDAFAGCYNLKTFDLSSATITALPDSLCNNMYAVTTVRLPKTLTSIGTSALEGCKKLEEINGLSDCKLTSIGANAFASCSALKGVDLSKSSFTALPASAFAKDTALTSVKLPDSLTEIGEKAFVGCGAMEKIDLSNTKLTTIGKNAMAEMNNLMYINLPDTVKNVGQSAFDISVPLDSSDTAFMPTIISENVNPSDVGYTENNTSPWKRRQVIFRDNAFTVRFDGNGSDGATANEPFFGYVGTKVTIPACKYKKKGYLFTGWNTKKDGSGTAYKAGTKTADTISVLYAQWKKAKYKVTLSFPGGTYTNRSGSRWQDSYSFTYTFTSLTDSNYLPFGGNMSKPDCSFVGWYTDEDYTKRVEKLTINNTTDNMILYAKWSDSHTHSWDSGVVTKQPTCTEAGTKTYTCTSCGKTKTTEIAATGHQHTEIRNKKDATCKEEGYTGDTYCTDCGAKVSSGQAIAKIDHTWDNGKVTTEATCEHTGVRTYTCSVCGETKEEETPKTDHTYDDGTVTKKPTCIETGIKTYTCTVCQKTKTEEIPATGHQHTEIRNKKEATCTETGYTGDTYCKDCGTKLSSGEVISKKAHDYEVKDRQKPTCTTDGYVLSVCKACGDEKQEVLPATGHQHTEIRNKKEATCKAEGYTGDMYCKDCGEKLSDGKTIAKTTEHTWDAGKVTKAATCTEKGVKTYTCTVCGATKTEEIAATGHQHTEVRNKVEATCTKEGYSGDVYCTDCGTKLSSGTEIAKKAHEYEERERNEANCKRNGYILFVCKVCGDEKREVLPKTDHQHTEIRNKVEATCTDEGYTGDTYCTDCGEKLSDGKKIPATGHIHIGYLGKKEATCENDGYTGDAYCKDCGITLEIGKNIPALGHTWEKKSVIAPTYTKKGTITYICKRCKEKKAVTTKKLAYPKVGTRYTVSGSTYKVTKAGAEVMVYKTSKAARSVTIPATIKAKGITYKVTSIGAKAFNSNKKLKKVTIGANIAKISNNAFYKCRSLKTVTIKSVLLTKKTASKRAFKGVGMKMVIKVPKKVKKAYVKIFKGLKVK
ncbi:leucine-rich repeat protein [Anaerobutyricum hallii]|uniref:leucine-rich repeat protein n=1 Tax=Anaerobutyricum hallii TaxID=39488 RepID=UPI0026757B9E|nr:leucine-rich repeat protein [Anaerobutyricum hallii]